MNAEVIIVISDNDSQNISDFLSHKWTNVLRYSVQKLPPPESIKADLCILDSGFDIDSGLTTLKQIKAHRPSLPIIFLTDVSSENIVIRVFRLGAREYFVKPVNLNHLQETIEKLLSVKHKVREKRTAYEVSTSSFVSKFFAESKPGIPTSIVRSLRYMENNLSENVTVDDLSQIANLSRFHFSRTFKRTTGMSPKRFLAYMRVEQAKQLLRDRDSKVSHIAAEVGFQDFSSFTRHFKHFEGVTPSEFKRKQRSG